MINNELKRLLLARARK